MITFKFENAGKIVDINCSYFPVDKIVYISCPGLYYYNTVKERIEFFGQKTWFYNHETRNWYVMEDENEDDCLECVQIVIN